MVYTETQHLPTEEELTVQEVNLSGPVLRAGAFHLGKACKWENNEFMLCKTELGDPRKCINEGKAVTNCALNFFRKVKKTCAAEFTQYATCLDKSSPDQMFVPCRKTQGVYDKCVLDNLGIERPSFDHFVKTQIHKTARPRPPVEPPIVYKDTPKYVPPEVPREPAKYGSRFFYMW